MKSKSSTWLKVGIASAVMLSLTVGVAMAVSEGRLTLYGGEGFQGVSRAFDKDQKDLSQTDYNDFAYSLKAVGRWQVCMDAGYVTRCREVSGDVANLGVDGGSISSLRYLGPSIVSTESPVAATSPVGRVFRSDWGDMTIARWQPGFAGTFDHQGGKLDGVVKGRSVSGTWYQSESGQQCPTVKGGTRYWGTYVFEFNADYTAYSGVWGYCGVAPDQPWAGTSVTTTAAMPVTPMTNEDDWQPMYRYDLPGNDYREFELAAGQDWKTCKAACDNDTRCVAWTMTVPGSTEHGMCYMKDNVPSGGEGECCVSGVKGAPSSAAAGGSVSMTPLASTDATSVPRDTGVVGRISKRATDAAERNVGDRVEDSVGKAIGKIFGQ